MTTKKAKEVAQAIPGDPHRARTPDGVVLDRVVLRRSGYRISDEPAEPNGQIAIIDERNGGAICPCGTKTTPYRALMEGYEVITARAMAVRLGYVGEARTAVADEIKSNLASATTVQRNLAFVAAVMNLPEAQMRPNAAARVASAYAETFTVAQAQRFIAGLPTEEADDEGTSRATASRPEINEPRLKRTVELRAAALRHNASNGDRAHTKELTDLQYALHVSEQTGAAISTALEFVGVQPLNYI